MIAVQPQVVEQQQQLANDKAKANSKALGPADCEFVLRAHFLMRIRCLAGRCLPGTGGCFCDARATV